MSKPANNRWVTPFPMQRAEFAFLYPNVRHQEWALKKQGAAESSII